MDIISTAVNVVVNGAITGGILWGFSKSRWFQAGEQVIKAAEPAIIHGLEDMTHAPELHLQLHETSSQLKQYALSALVQAVVEGAGESYEKLSSSEQAAAIKFVQIRLPKGLEATAKEIVGAFKDAPKKSKELADELQKDATYMKAKELTLLLNSANEPEAPKPDVSKTTQNPPADNGQTPATAVS